MRLRAGLIALGLGVVVLAGCSGPGLAPVKGRVTCKGTPVKQVFITFSPVPANEKDLEPGRPATGFTEDDGTFVLSTHKVGDGAQIGRHTVNVKLDDTNPCKCKHEKVLTYEVKPGSNELEIELDP